MKKILNLIALLGLVGLGQTNAATIFAGDVAVYRVGATSASAMTSGNYAVFVDVFRNTGGAWSLNQTIAMPTAVSGNNQILTASGTAGSEGFINMSEDGRYFVLGGYNRATTTTAGASGNGIGKYSNDRTIGLLTLSSGSVDTTTHGAWGVGATTGQNIRSVASNDGTSFYATTDGGIYYGAYGTSAAAPSLIKAGNVRVLEISQGNLLVDSGSSSGIATGSTAGAIGTTSGLPTSTATMTVMFNEKAGTAVATPVYSPYGFSLLDLNKDGVDETAYIADSGGGINKMYFDGNTWASKGVITGTYAGLEAVYNGTSVDIFVTAANGLTLGTLNDASGINGALTGTVTTIGTADANTAFRGVAVAAVTVPEPSAQALLGLGMVALVAVRALRRGREEP